MTRFKVFYQNDLHTKIINASNHEILTDAPLDNGGKGELFSPTDLLAASLGSCIVTVLGLFANRKNIDLSGMYLEVEKEMSTKGTRCIRHLKIDLFLEKKFSEEINHEIEKIAHNCPVHKSLHPDIQIEILIHWP